MRPFHEYSSSLPALRKVAVTFALMLGAAQFAGSVPARAGMYEGGGGGGAEDHDYGADHDEIYQVQRGDLVCNSREACGGAAAIPMNRPGWFYLPHGLYSQLAPAPAPYHHHRRKR
ncbi:MAG: hypothetical protein ACHQAQ_03860 [Hyphomicrobiales bacterium]